MNFILHEKENCIGCAACTSLDPENWELNEQGKSHLKGSIIKENNEIKNIDVKDLEKHTDVAYCCPVNIIHVYHNNKKII